MSVTLLYHYSTDMFKMKTLESSIEAQCPEVLSLWISLNVKENACGNEQHSNPETLELNTANEKMGRKRPKRGLDTGKSQ